MDLSALLPLLGLGGSNVTGDLSALLGILNGSNGTDRRPPAVDVSPDHARGRTPDYSRLYPPGQHIADLPRRDAPQQPRSNGIDPAQLIGLLAALRRTSPPAQPAAPSAPAPDFAPTATAEIRDSLRALLDRTVPPPDAP